MKIENKVKLSITKITDFVEPDGSKCLKCVCESSSIRYSKKTNRKYKQKEVYFNTFLRGDEQQFEELRKRMLERTLEIEKDKQAHPNIKDRKIKTNRTIVTIYAYGCEVVNFWFPATKTSCCSLYVDEWDFTTKKMAKHEQKMFTKEEVENMLEKEKHKTNIKIEKALAKQKSDIVNSSSRRVQF